LVNKKLEQIVESTLPYSMDIHQYEDLEVYVACIPHLHSLPDSLCPGTQEENGQRFAHIQDIGVAELKSRRLAIKGLDQPPIANTTHVPYKRGEEPMNPRVRHLLLFLANMFITTWSHSVRLPY
jgi:hypothetical protein